MLFVPIAVGVGVGAVRCTASIPRGPSAAPCSACPSPSSDQSPCNRSVSSVSVVRPHFHLSHMASLISSQTHRHTDTSLTRSHAGRGEGGGGQQLQISRARVRPGHRAQVCRHLASPASLLLVRSSQCVVVLSVSRLQALRGGPRVSDLGRFAWLRFIARSLACLSIPCIPCIPRIHIAFSHVLCLCLFQMWW